LKGIVIAVAPDDPLDGAPDVVGAIDPLVDPAEEVGAEEALAAAVVVALADVVAEDVVAEEDVSMEKVDVIIVIFTVMTVSLHQPIQNM